MALYTGALDARDIGRGVRRMTVVTRDSKETQIRAGARAPAPASPTWPPASRSSITCWSRSRATPASIWTCEATRRPAPPPDRGRRDRARRRRSRRSRPPAARATASAPCRWTTRWCRSCSTSAGGRTTAGGCPSPLYDHFMRSFADNARATLHVRVLRGTRPAPRRGGGVQGARAGAARGAGRDRRGVQHQGSGAARDRRRRDARADPSV